MTTVCLDNCFGIWIIFASPLYSKYYCSCTSFVTCEMLAGKTSASFSWISLSVERNITVTYYILNVTDFSEIFAFHFLLFIYHIYLSLHIYVYYYSFCPCVFWSSLSLNGSQQKNTIINFWPVLFFFAILFSFSLLSSWPPTCSMFSLIVVEMIS